MQLYAIYKRYYTYTVIARTLVSDSEMFVHFSKDICDLNFNLPIKCINILYKYEVQNILQVTFMFQMIF